jgi:hypothetical protein
MTSCWELLLVARTLPVRAAGEGASCPQSPQWGGEMSTEPRSVSSPVAGPQATIGYFVRDDFRVECVRFVEELKQRIERARAQAAEKSQ